MIRNAISSSTEPVLILTAVRCWRMARDMRQPVQPALFAALNGHRCGLLAPVFDSLLGFYEACMGRMIVAGSSVGDALSRDEQNLIDLLDSPEEILSTMEPHRKPGLVPAMRIALRSTRIAVLQALSPCCFLKPAM